MPEDNRIRLPATKIDFDADVGTTGQDHDTYPAPGQARFDHMRMFLIGLLSQQSSMSTPSQFRNGTPWFDLDNQVVKMANNGVFQKYSEFIAVRGDDEDGGQLTLADWFAQVATFLDAFSPEVTFSGSSNADGQTSIPIPPSLQAVLGDNIRCFLFKNGLLVDPRNCSIILSGSTPSSIKISNTTLDTDDTFTVILRSMSGANFYTPSVTIP